ncbi:unnamed protein product [Sphagnum jensenii]|jgi:hypothetical protein|uniref:Uncharacterized protein n=1 Tax=Sphagnum jensenii TaxID=128206 RepID=A0ABP0W9I3_9BRYO
MTTFRKMNIMMVICRDSAGNAQILFLRSARSRTPGFAERVQLHPRDNSEQILQQANQIRICSSSSGWATNLYQLPRKNPVGNPFQFLTASNPEANFFHSTTPWKHASLHYEEHYERAFDP